MKASKISVSILSLVFITALSLIIVQPGAVYAVTISDDATGGNFTAIGTRDAQPKTCNLTAGVAAAKQKVYSRQAGKSSVYFFDIAATNTQGIGKLMINVKQHKFIFNGKDFDPLKTYYLQYTVDGIPGIHTFASVTTTPSGNVHIEGTWTRDLMSSATAPTFTVSTATPLYAELHFAADEDYIYENGVYTFFFYFDAHGSTGEIVRFELYSSLSYWGDDMLYSGPYHSLNYNYWEWYSAPLSVRMNAEYAYADLYVYDCFGNSSHDRIDILHDVRE